MHMTLKQHAYKVIRKRLISGDILSGQRLSDDAFAKEFGISRSPVREAISQLASEGLVDYRPRSGAYVRAPGQEELFELYETRQAIEPFAAAKATERIQPQDLATLKRLCREAEDIVAACRELPGQLADKPTTDRFLSLDHELHMVILAAAGNKRLKRMVDDCKMMVRVFGHVPIVHDAPLFELTTAQHIKVVDAIERGDSQAAAAAMREHIEYAQQLVLPHAKKDDLEVLIEATP